jgi:hypothetical protein
VDRLTVELPEGQDPVSRNALPYLHGHEAGAVARVLASGHYTHGPVRRGRRSRSARPRRGGTRPSHP